MLQIQTPTAHLVSAVESYLSGTSDGSVVDIALFLDEAVVPGLPAFIKDVVQRDANIEPELVRDSSGCVVAVNLFTDRIVG